jgi:hypothetical protein
MLRHASTPAVCAPRCNCIFVGDEHESKLLNIACAAMALHAGRQQAPDHADSCILRAHNGTSRAFFTVSTITDHQQAMADRYADTSRKHWSSLKRIASRAINLLRCDWTRFRQVDDYTALITETQTMNVCEGAVQPFDALQIQCEFALKVCSFQGFECQEGPDNGIASPCCHLPGTIHASSRSVPSQGVTTQGLYSSRLLRELGREQLALGFQGLAHNSSRETQQQISGDCA